MALPEQGPEPDRPEPHPTPEQEPGRYQRAARFAGERPAGQAYAAVQQVIYEAPEPTEVSVYRLQFNRVWHVAALGLVPPASVLQALEAILDTGEPAELPAEVWQALAERRAQATRRGPWVERHHRPGTRL
jgi:hypothetical protein